MKVYYVRVKKCAVSTNWYANRIGQLFKCYKMTEKVRDNYWLVDDIGKVRQRSLYPDDVELEEISSQ